MNPPMNNATCRRERKESSLVGLLQNSNGFLEFLHVGVQKFQGADLARHACMHCACVHTILSSWEDDLGSQRTATVRSSLATINHHSLHKLPRVAGKEYVLQQCKLPRSQPTDAASYVG